MVTKKCYQRLHFLRILKYVHVAKGIISLFYKSIVESIIIFSITAWYGKLTCKDKKKARKNFEEGKKIDADTKATDRLYKEGVMKQVEKIMKDAHHPPVQSVCIPEVRKKATLAHTTHRRV